MVTNPSIEYLIIAVENNLTEYTVDRVRQDSFYHAAQHWINCKVIGSGKIPEYINFEPTQIKVLNPYTMEYKTFQVSCECNISVKEY